MRPFGRLKNLKGLRFKVDYRIRRNGRKVKNWWEDLTDKFSKKTERQQAKRQIRDDSQSTGG